MKIEIIKSVEEAHIAKGLAVVIDVFRAFSTEAYIFANGAGKIIPVRDLDEAHRLKKENPDFILLGERGGLKVEGFDYGNSPTEILNVDFSGKTIIHTTSNGTKGIINAINADTILAGSFLTASSIIKFIQQNNIENVFLVSTSHDVENHNEDILCAHYIRDVLEGKEISESEIKDIAAKTNAYSELFDELDVPKTDFELCLDINKFDFVIKTVKENGRIYLVKEVIK